MNTPKAFTLIELLVVVAIVGVLASIGIYSFSNFTSIAKDAAIKAQHKGIHDFIDLIDAMDIIDVIYKKIINNIHYLMFNFINIFYDMIMTILRNNYIIIK